VAGLVSRHAGAGGGARRERLTDPGVRAVRAVLEASAPGRDVLAAGARIERLAGGLSNRTWLAASAAGDLVVRLGGTHDLHLAADRVGERQALAAAHALGFGPRIVHADPRHGVLVTERIPGRTWLRADARSALGIERLGARLKALHDAPPPRGVRRVDICDAVAHYLELRELPAGPVGREVLADLVRWALGGYRPLRAALCHHDLHHLNIIDAGTLMFVDWEYAGVGDPLIDLAAVACYHDFDESQRAALLAAYAGGVDAAAFSDACLIFDCLHALWLDAAGGWKSLEPARREALLARLAFEPPVRRRR